MLSLVLGATTHSFELMLSAFITGLAFGGLWIEQRIDRVNEPIRFSGYVQLIMGALALLTIPVYVMSFEWMPWIRSALQPSDAGFAGYSIVSHAIALAVMLPTTFMAGMTLPLFTYVLLRKDSGESSIGRIYAANTLGAIAGVLPMAYAPDATHAANIGMGSGQTAHTILGNPRIEVVDTVEIEVEMVNASRHYGEQVARVYDDPRSRIHIEDAKTYFSLNNTVYDFIIAEPSNPWVSGVSSLFSQEFYATVRNCLEDEGIFVQ